MRSLVTQATSVAAQIQTFLLETVDADKTFSALGRFFQASLFTDFVGTEASNVARDSIAVEMVRLHTLWSFNAIVPLAVDRFNAIQDDLAENWIGDINPDLFDVCIDFGEPIGQILQEFYCSEWYELPANPVLDGLSKFESLRVKTRHQIAVNAQNGLHQFLLVRFAKEALCYTSRDPSDDQLTGFNAEFTRALGRLQVDVAGQKRRETIYEKYRSAWESSREDSHHPGVRELLRIFDALNKLDKKDSYSVWPTKHVFDDDNVDGTRDLGNLSDDGVDSHILYTEKETYGVFYRNKDSKDHKFVSLRMITRPAGFKKRAPFLFWFGVYDATFTLIAWHAPSSSLTNESARRSDFPRFLELIGELADSEEEPIVTVGDFNIDTQKSGDIPYSKGVFDANHFFSTLLGEVRDPEYSLYWGNQTTFRQSAKLSAEETGLTVDDLHMDCLASAFDWIAEHGQSCHDYGMVLQAEIIVPLLWLLADDWQAAHLNSAQKQDLGDTIEDIDLSDLFRTGDKGALIPVLKPMTATDLPAKNGAIRIAADILSRCRRLSDHVPIMAMFTITCQNMTEAGEGVRGTAYLTDGILTPEFGASSRFGSPDSDGDSRGYRNIGGGDCLFHAVLNMIEENHETYAEGNGNFVAFPDGLAPDDDVDLITRIQRFRTLVQQEIQTYPARYDPFLTDLDYLEVADELAQMGSWDHIGGDLAPSAIANILNQQFGVMNMLTGEMTPINAVATHDAPYANSPYIHYNGTNHYW